MPEENELQMSSDAILSIRYGVILVSKLKQLVFVQTKKKHVFLSNVFIYIYGDKRWIMVKKKVRQNYKARQNNWLLRRFCLYYKRMYPPYGMAYIWYIRIKLDENTQCSAKNWETKGLIVSNACNSRDKHMVRYYIVLFCTILIKTAAFALFWFAVQAHSFCVQHH